MSKKKRFPPEQKKEGTISGLDPLIELKYVPCGIHTLCRLLVSATEYEKPVLDTDWISPGGGRPPIATLDEIKTMAESMESLQGRVWSDSDFRLVTGIIRQPRKKNGEGWFGQFVRTRIF